MYKWVFSERLNVSGDEHRRIASGRVFQARGPATEKARSPSVERRVASRCTSFYRATHTQRTCIARYMLRPDVCLSQVGVLSTRRTGSSWFSVQKLLSAYPTLRCKGIRITLKSHFHLNLLSVSEYGRFFSVLFCHETSTVACWVSTLFDRRWQSNNNTSTARSPWRRASASRGPSATAKTRWTRHFDQRNSVGFLAAISHLISSGTLTRSSMLRLKYFKEFHTRASAIGRPS